MKASDIYKEIFTFFDNCRNVYLYGNGHYGKAMLHLLECSGRKVSGVLVSSNELCIGNVCYFSSVEKKLDLRDGVIFSMSEKNVASIDKRKKSLSRCLFLKDWQLDEVCKLDYYQIIGQMPNLNVLAYYYHRIEIRLYRYLRRISLHNKNIDSWHMITKSEKPYCDNIIKYILGTKTKGLIVELGCGLCDIIGDGRLNGYERIGMDIDESVIDEAKLHYRNIDLRQGSFDDIGENKNIHFLIMMNFLHEIPPEELRTIFEGVFSRNRVDYFIADECTGNYKNIFNLIDILPTGYVQDTEIGIYPSDGGVRIVRAFVRRDCMKLVE
ncbi:MAG: class I SAM-dependent methyltransferase [Butyrivibrio sp.]|nr:class I SAM-dependent methyltransferase [Butyrivibrio sp.]